MFDHETGRCLDCDGHFRHFPGCAYYEGETVVPLALRLEIFAATR